jgi:hypothetical protein
LQVTGYWLPVAGCRLPVASYWFTSYKFQVTGCWIVVIKLGLEFFILTFAFFAIHLVLGERWVAGYWLPVASYWVTSFRLQGAGLWLLSWDLEFFILTFAFFAIHAVLLATGGL